jgi:hypothetical protein
MSGVGRTAARAIDWAAGLVATALPGQAGLDEFELGDVDELEDVRPVLELVQAGPPELQAPRAPTGAQ